MIALALALLLTPEGGPLLSPALRASELPDAKVCYWQCQLYRQHLEHLHWYRQFYGWCDGVWDNAILQTQQAIEYWDLCNVIVTSDFWLADFLNRCMWSLCELEGPWWGPYHPPLIPEPPSPMPYVTAAGQVP